MRSRLLACILTCLVSVTSMAAANEPVRVPESPLFAFADRVAEWSGSSNTPANGNYISIINDGYDALLLRVHLIRSAKQTIDVQTFILENDECGRLLMYELIQAAKRGVKIRLLADHFMSERERDWVAFLSVAHENMELKYYRPPANHINPPKLVELMNALLFFGGVNQRMHNKVMIFDSQIALVGGRNIDNHYYNHSTSYNFLDRDALVMGPVLPEIEKSFGDFWGYWRAVRAGKLADVAIAIKKGTAAHPETREDFNFNGFFTELDIQAEDSELVRERFVESLMPVRWMEFVWDSPGKNKRIGIWGGGRVTSRVRKLMKDTEEELVLQSPYLVLNNRGRRMFRKLKRRKPESNVIVSTNSFAATDNTLAYSANFKLRPSYIQNMGFQIYEYMPHPDDMLELLPDYTDLESRAEQERKSRKPYLSIHAKSFVRDGRIAYVGSYNVDPRSVNLNTEVGLFIEDERIASAIRDEILARTTSGSSWVIARKEIPLAEVNYLIEGISGLSPIDIWPLRNTSSFELIPGKEPLPPDHEDFYDNYKDVGGFPGSEGISTKEIVTQLYRVFGTLAIPMI